LRPADRQIQTSKLRTSANYFGACSAGSLQFEFVISMLTPLILAGLVLLMLGVFSSRFFNERATKLLSPQEKLTLLDSFSRLRVFGTLPLLLIFLSFFGMPYLPASLFWPAFIGAWALVGVYFVIVHRVVSGRLRALGINSEFQKAYAKARWPLYFGLLAFFIASIWNLLARR
jgi:hypothetical protein